MNYCNSFDISRCCVWNVALMSRSSFKYSVRHEWLDLCILHRLMHVWPAVISWWNGDGNLWNTFEMGGMVGLLCLLLEAGKHKTVSKLYISTSRQVARVRQHNVTTCGTHLDKFQGQASKSTWPASPIVVACGSWPGFTKLTALVKPPTSGSGLPDWFDRKPVETGWIQIQIQKHMCNRFRPVYRPVYRSGLTDYRCFN